MIGMGHQNRFNGLVIFQHQPVFERTVPRTLNLIPLQSADAEMLFQQIPGWFPNVRHF